MPLENDHMTIMKGSGSSNKSKKMSKDTKVPKDDKKMDDDMIVDKKNSGTGDETDLTTDDIFRLADFYFYRKNYIFRHLYDSYNKFLEEDVKRFMETGDHIFTEHMTSSTFYRYRFKYENVRIDEPTLSNGIEPMFPSDARHSRLTYSVKLIADVSQYQDAYDIATDHKTTTLIGRKEENYHIGTIPLMVRSKWCTLTKNKEMDKNECDYDAGGYFIVGGNEKVIICQDRMAENTPLVFIKKDSGATSHVVQVNSKSYESHGMTQVITIKMKKDNILMLKVPILNEVNICAVFRALGLESDKDIIDFISYDEYDIDMVDLIRVSLEACKNDRGNKICTQEEAIDYLIPKLRILKKIVESDKETKMVQKKLHLKNLLQNNFLPHVPKDLRQKAYYLGLMVNRLLRVFLGRLPIDDRDSYTNKRVDLPGDLMFELYKQQDKKCLGECKKFFDNRNKGHDNPINVISNIKPNLIEQGYKAALSTGHWIRRQGVAQMLQRLTYLQTICFLRRIDAPGGDASSGKLTGPRQLHPSQVPFLCCAQTPEHAKVGLTKHLTIISSLTIMSADQYMLLKDYMSKKVINVNDIPRHLLRDPTIYKVFLNGEWLGVTNKYLELSNDLAKMKLKGEIDQKNVSIITDHEEGDIKVFCDSGRLYRPVLRVENNKIVLNKSHIALISLNKADKLKGKITDWDEFTTKYNNIIEYIDCQLQPYLLIADKVRRVSMMRDKMEKSIDLSKDVTVNHVDNRYNDLMFLRYTHCEIHPSLLLGEITTNVPFCDRNAGARNVFCYAQSRQSMGIYATNYRDRLDISFILYHPQRALVTTRSAKYTNSELMPAGENCIVAIACYTGYNQEDSLIFNKSSIERGKFRAMYLKKYIVSVQKNQSTSQDDILCKPDPTKTSNTKHGSYDKLNDKGYVPEETKIENGDIIFGKVTPVSDSGTGKPFRDSSEAFKMHASGVVDRVYIDHTNQDGYLTREALVRSERIPRIGDKYCFPENVDVDVLTNNGWINIKDIKMSDKVATLIDHTHLSYENPVGIYNFDYDGDIYKLRSQMVDLDVTMNHELYVKKHDKKYYELVKAELIKGTQYNLKKNCENINPDIKTFDLIEGKSFDMDTWLKFFGIWIAEGCAGIYGKNKVPTVSTVVCKPRVKDVFSDIVTSMGYTLISDEKHHESVIIKGNECINLVEYLLQFGKSLDKFLPNWVWDLSQRQSRILLEHLILGDGCISGGIKGSNNYKNSACYYTSSTKLADDVMKLAIHCGWSANIKLMKEAGNQVIIRGKTITSNAINWKVKIIKAKNEPQINHGQKGQSEEIYKFKGKIYCLEVKSHVMMIRQNKKNVWIGNSSKHGQKGTIGILLDGIDMPFTKEGIRPDIILNPNAIPSRMTIGQIIECLVGKTAAIMGMDADGTAFEDHDIDSVKIQLKKLGYDENGYEYLYNGMTGEKMKVAIYIGPTYYQRLKHLVEDKLHCLEKTSHEVLTLDGWKFFDKITLDDKIACLKDGKLVYDRPIKLLDYPNYKGKMYHIETQQIDLTVTMNHRMWTSRVYGRKKKWLSYNFELAEDIIGKHRKYKKNADWDVPDYQFKLPEEKCDNGFIYPARDLNMDAWLKFLGLWIAEGCIVNTEISNNSSKYIILLCIHKNRIKKIIEKVMNDLSYSYNCYDNVLRFCNKQLWKYLSELSVGASNKFLPEWVWKLSQRQCRILLTYMIMGDGSYDKSGSERYYTSSIQLADDVMRLALHCGWSANKYLHCKAGSKHIIREKTVITQYDVWRLGIVKTKNTPEVNHSHVKNQNIQKEYIIENFEGDVFCLQVPSEVFYVRRNGLACWTGNSRSRGPKTSLTRQAPEGRSRDGGLRLGEMERDALLAHGLAKFIKEKLIDNSDPYVVWVCDECGLFAQRFERKENQAFSQEDDTYYCKACNNHNNISKLRIPYAFKLFLHEMMAMCIAPRIRCKKTIYNS